MEMEGRVGLEKRLGWWITLMASVECCVVYPSLALKPLEIIDEERLKSIITFAHSLRQGQRSDYSSVAFKVNCDQFGYSLCTQRPLIIQEPLPLVYTMNMSITARHDLMSPQ
jgi:hypothetical protein